MKHLIVIAMLAALGGCATAPHDRYGYNKGSSGYAQPADPSQWRVVSVTPVPRGTAERVAAESGSGSSIEYASTPVAAAPVYQPAPIYQPAPVYVPAPLYVEPAYYYPPVSLSLGFMFGRNWGWGGHGRIRGGSRHR